MCGRFTQTQSATAYADWFEAENTVGALEVARYNVAPTDEVYAVIERDERRALGRFRWGLIPWWSDDASAASRHINARMETAATKPAFRDAFARRRCLIPADGFYEWEPIPDKAKLPHYIYAAAGGPLAFAGLWASWRDPGSGDRLHSCTILTTKSLGEVRRLHDRMPVSLPRGSWDAWLDPERADADGLTTLLREAAGSVDLAEHAVSTLVNSVRNDLPECIAPLRPGGDDQPGLF